MAEDEGDIAPLSDTEEEEEEEDEEEKKDEEHGKKKKKSKQKKGNWKNIGSTPKDFATYPCECRWKVKFPKEPCIKYKQVRWVTVPLSDRIAQMALPLMRRLLALWLEFGDKFPPEMRDRLKGFLNDNYGLTPEFLEQIHEESKIAKEEKEKEKSKKSSKDKSTRGSSNKGKKKGGKKGKKRRGKKGKKKGGKKGKKKGGKKGKKKGGKKGKKKEGKKGKKKGGKKGKKKEGKKRSVKGEKEEKESKEKKAKTKSGGLSFKRRKSGKLPFGWPHKMGSKFILMCISCLSQDPDEDFNSRATEYFDVQSMAILEQMCKFLDMPLPNPERPTQYGETLVIMALNLSDWIAKYIVSPAQEITDEKVEEYLDLRGKQPKVQKPKNKKKGKTKNEQGSEEPNKRVWDELKSPVYVPPKTRKSKRKSEGDNDEEGFVTETDLKERVEDGSGEGLPRWKSQTLDDVKKEFLEYLIWYDPRTPEFMYLGPKIIPSGIEMYKIRDADSEDVPDDLRILNWNLNEYEYTDGYSFIPSPVPQYYPYLRPLRPVRLEDLERSGIPKEVIKQNLRFFSPWYIMSIPLRTPLSALNEEGNECAGEDGDEQFEDKLLKPSFPVVVKDSLWGDYIMKEQLEILVNIFHLAASVPELTIEHVFELLEEFCYAVECAETDENSSEENKLILKKRTIILERYFLKFFGKKFRDYNDRTPHYMRVICTRLAYYIQLLYEFTAKTLWELQSRPNLPSAFGSSPATPDDPQSLQDWDEWIKWLLKLTKTCDEWAGWISETVDEAEKKAEKKKGEYIGADGKPERLTREEWTSWKEDVEEKIQEYKSMNRLYSKEATYYAERAKDILPVKHRPVQVNEKAEGDEETNGEVDWEDVTDSDEHENEQNQTNEDRNPIATDTEETTAGETEYEEDPGNP